MSGINLGKMAETGGYPPRMGLAEAKGRADKIYENNSEPALCGICGKGDSREVFGQVIILRYGVCRTCLSAGDQTPSSIQERGAHRLATWEQLREALKLVVAYLPESVANTMSDEELAQIDAALELEGKDDN